MLAVVEDEQELAVLHILDHGLDHRASRLFHHAQHRRDGLWHQPRVGERREFHEPDAIHVVVHHRRRHFKGQAGLAEAAHAEQREEPRLP
jgi:hypothetical protein